MFKLNINLAVKDSFGGWKDNAHVYKSPKACTTFKNLMGSLWAPYIQSFGINDKNCPIPPVIFLYK